MGKLRMRTYSREHDKRKHARTEAPSIDLSEDDVVKESKLALEHCKQTGLHVTRKEFSAWLNELTLGKPFKPLVCHK